MRIFICTSGGCAPKFQPDGGLIAASGDPSRMSTPMNRFVQSFRKWRRYRETYNELSRLSDRGLADVGINRVDINRIARLPIE